MKVQCIFTMKIFRRMVVVSRSIPALSKSLGQTQPMTLHPTSAFGPINPNTFAYSTSTWASTKQSLKRVVDGSSEYNFGNERCFEVNIPRSSEHGPDERSGVFPKFSRPRPQQVPWQEEIDNRVYFIGRIIRPVQFKFAQSGKAFAWTSFAVPTGLEGKTMWFGLKFWNELAEIAAQHLKKFDTVYVSGALTSNALVGKDGQQRIFYQVIAQTLSFVERKASTFSQQMDVKLNAASPAVSQHTVVNENTWSPVVSQQTFTNRVTSFPYQECRIMPSGSGKNAQGGSNIESLWQTFFANPFEWWDNRTKKRNPRAPDFKHKDSGEALWIESKYSPSWVKSQLVVLDSRLDKWGESGSSTRSRVSLSSVRNSDF